MRLIRVCSPVWRSAGRRACPTRPVLYMGGGTGGLEEPCVSSSLDFLLMMGRRQGVVMTRAVLSVQQTRDRQLVYNLGSAGLGRV